MSWSQIEANIAKGFGENYDPRIEQTHLAEAIESYVSTGDSLLAEAPTGTGKSIAGLGPMIEHAISTQRKTLVSTGTKGLQDQYLAKELPFLREHSGLEFDYAILKGRSNYFCMAAGDEAVKAGVYPGLAEYLADPATSGDMDLIPTELIPGEERSQFTVTSDECPGKSDCPFGAVCFAERAKAAAAEADVVVVNHALLVVNAAMATIDAEAAPAILPEFDTVLIDEAHELENYATSALGDEITQRSITDFVDQASKFLHEIAKVDGTDARGGDRLAVAAKEAAERLYGAVEATLRQAKLREMPLTDAVLLTFEDDLVEVIQTVEALRQQVVTARADYQTDAVRTKRKRLMKRGLSLHNKIIALIPEASDHPPIRWISMTDPRKPGSSPRVVIGHAPLNVGPMLRQTLWSRVSSAVLMSATLSVDGDFAYIRERLGLPEDFAEFTAESPFDYDKQSAIFVPEKAVPAGDGRGSWETQVCSTITDLVSVIGGRALLLFTSRTAMTDTFDSVAERLEDMGFNPIMQGAGVSTAAMVEAKRNDPTVVLFGLKTFFQGIDIPGDALQLVIIDKLPFPNPSAIVFAARAEDCNKRYRDRWASFSKMSVPMMSLDLQQGTGRLIRTKSDRGLIVIMDSRMHPSTGNKNSKSYGRKIYDSLHGGRRLDTIQEARAYLAELAADHD